MVYILRFKDLREDKDLYQKQVASVLNVTQQHYSRIELGINQCSYEQLKKLAFFYNTSIDYILGITNEKKAYPRAKNS